VICRDVVELMTDYLEGALAPADLVRFEAHIADCDGCRAYLEQMRTTLKLTGRISTTEPLSPSLEKELTSAFKDWRSRQDGSA
jgi:predicted anti-sigma-YlaC factor YlaD